MQPGPPQGNGASNLRVGMCVIDSGHEKKCVAVSQEVKPARLSLNASANLETHMPLGTLAIRKKDSNPTHHLYRNGNLWWVHFFVHHSGFKARRVRKSLRTGSLTEAITRRDKLFEEIRQNGLQIPERPTSPRRESIAAPRAPVYEYAT